MTLEQLIEQAAMYIRKYAPQYDIKVCSPILGQLILESGRGTSELAVNANNYLGLKYKVGRCPSAIGIYHKVGSEQDPNTGQYASSAMQWCKFANLEGCIKGYFEFISHSRYTNLKGVTDPKKYLELIKADGYATSINYVANVWNVIQTYNLTKYDSVNAEENIVTNINSDLEIRQCILVNNDCYKQHKKMTPSGIVVHSTGANNPNLKRYVQPNDGILGVNPYNNHWNKSGVSKCVHAFIGKDANGIVRVYQTLPWDYCCWGSGSGKNGTYNNKYIQFEICEDALTDANYFNQAFSLAIELCSYLVKKYNISILNIVSHNEAYKRGYATGHVDCDHWLNKHGKTMDWFRNQVSNQSGITTSTSTSTNISSSVTEIQKVNVTYAVKVEGGKVLPAVTNLADYAGIENKKITGIAMKVDKGSVKYQVHVLDGDWLPYVTGYNWNDHKNGYAGNNKPIDAVRVYYNTPSDLVANGGYREAKYRVSPVGSVSYYDWQLDDTVNKAKGMDGYAGAFGKAIDKFQICIE